MRLDDVRRLDPAEADGTLLLFLHGRGVDGGDLASLARALRPGARALLPDGPYRFAMGCAWYEQGARQRETLLQTSAALRKLLSDARARWGLRSDRTAIVGFSQGAVVALDLLLTLPGPEAPAAALALSGYLHDASRERAVAAVTGRRAFVAHGLHDDIVPPARAQEAHDQLESMGIHTTLQLYPMAHAIVDAELGDARAALAAAFGDLP